MFEHTRADRLQTRALNLPEFLRTATSRPRDSRDEQAARNHSLLIDWITALRIREWVKNVFVFLPFLFGPRYGFNIYLLLSVTGVFLFGLLSSAVYLLNDIVDIRSDRLHPEKRFRPIAAGRISATAAAVVSAILFLASISAAWLLNQQFFLALCVYAANNLVYSFYLKKKTVVDVMSIAVGFVLRCYAGAFIIDIDVTKWLLVCILSLSLLLGFGKRRLEIGRLRTDAADIRKVHESYTVDKLNSLLNTSGAVTIVTYMLYTLAPETKAIHGTDRLLFTTPFVIYCVYRYMLKVQESREGDLVRLMFRDRGFVVAGFLWMIVFVWIVH